MFLNFFCRVEETGRCFIFEEGNIFGSYPPATASLAADIAIHGHLFAATAGVESALTGTPTLMLDREGYSMSPLYELGVGRVIFKAGMIFGVLVRNIGILLKVSLVLEIGRL